MTDQTTGNNPNAAADQQVPGAQLAIQRIYTKDMSFEAPNLPELYSQEYKPEIKMDMNSKSRKVADDHFEVVLHITVTSNLGDKTAFLAEVQQAAVFFIQGLDENQLRGVLSTMCPEIIFPYARETIANLVTRGGFPPLQLAPVNFNQLYAERMRKEAEQAQAGTDTVQ